jgi:hypothetical protein
MKRILLATFMVINVVQNTANAHCYKFWYYKEPQNCGVAYRSHSHRMALLQPHTNGAVNNINYDIPLPDMNANWGSTLDSQLELQLRLKALGYQSDN